MKRFGKVSRQSVSLVCAVLLLGSSFGMQKGIPYLQREKEKEKYRVTDEEPGR